MSDEIVDLVFDLRGEAVALDYADKLLQALLSRLPWLADQPSVGIHPLTGVSPGDRELYFTRRARLGLRLPKERCDSARVLTGAQLDLGGTVEVGDATMRNLGPFKTLYSSFVTVGMSAEDEFLAACGEQLKTWGIVAELVCGKARRGTGIHGEWRGFSLMLHGLSPDDSLRVQQEGIGFERKRGCGIFVPHKSIVAVS